MSSLAERLGPLRGRIPGVEAELPLAVPESEEALVELVNEARVGGLRLLPIGSGSRLGGAYGAQADLLVSTRALTGVVAYEPGDGTVTALAGTRMSELASAVLAGGHRLTPDVPRPEEATLGGVIADGFSGSDRLRFGPTRHHVLGMRVLSSDGEVTKTGGRLVKNVTGFELHRLYAGSGGGLCLILEASLRLFAAPAARACATFTCDSLEAALAISEHLGAPPLEPTAVSLSLGDGAWALTATLDGREERVTRERALVDERVPGAAWCAGAEADSLHATCRDDSPREGAVPSLRISARPSRARDVIEVLLRHSPEAALQAQPLVGTVEAVPGSRADLDALCADLRGLGASVRLRGAAEQGARPTNPLEQRLKAAVDPHDLFCGRP
ncbi:MAG: FAD-binding oxidoreductase [Planctomycetes bacterium]|nr:FAD-binding oxidoreductase [Planctomycetota bacterium]